MKKVLFLVLLIGVIFVGCHKTEKDALSNNSYKIEEFSNQNWRFTGGEFIIAGDKQEFKYSKVEYIGIDEFTINTIFIEFTINKILNEKSNSDEKGTTIYTYSEGSNEGVVINSNYLIENGGIKGQLFEIDTNYTNDSISMTMKYNKNGNYIEEELILPMKKMVVN